MKDRWPVILFAGTTPGNGRWVTGWVKSTGVRGIATQVLALFLECVTERPVYAYVAKHNIGSLRVLEKCGFKLIEEEVNGGADKDKVDEYIFKLAG